MRAALFLASLLLASAAAARVTFVAPLEGAQAIGVQLLEITTDAPNVDRVDFSVDGALAGVARKPPFRVAVQFGTSLTARTITARVWSNGFRTSEEATIVTAAMTANDTLNVDVVELPIRVRSTSAVKAADLRVRENGVEQRVRDVRAERPPAHFAFVVDRSLSMGGGKLEAALRAVRAELRQLRPGDTSSLVLFNHQVERPRDLGCCHPERRVEGPGRAAHEDRASRPAHPGPSTHARDDSSITPSGGTSLRDAVASIASKQRTYAIVITDGGDRNSVLSDEAALRTISGARTVVSAIVLGDSHARFLDRAAANTGGSVIEASKETVARELQRVLADINSRYLVVYQSAGTKRGWRKIDVETRRRGVSVTSARKEYFAE